MILRPTKRELVTGGAALAASSVLAGNYQFSRVAKGGGTANWLAAMAALAGGNTPWVDADFQNARYFDGVNGLTTVGAQWVQDLTWGVFDPTKGIVPGSGLTTVQTAGVTYSTPIMAAAVAAALVGGTNDTGPTITIRLQAAGANTQNGSWFMGRLDLINQNCLDYIAVNSKTLAQSGFNFGNGSYSSANNDSGFAGITAVPLNGGHLAAVIYPDLSAKLSCGGGSVVNAALRPSPYTPSDTIGLDFTVPSQPSVGDFDLQRATFWLGDLSAYLTALSA